MKNIIILLLAIAGIAQATNQTIDHRQLVSQELTYLEQRGGPLTQQELEHIKQRAAQIVNLSIVREFVAAIATKAVEKSTLVGASKDEIFDATTAHDIKLLADCVDFIHHTSGSVFAEISRQLHTAADAPDHKKQLAHSLAYLMVLGLEIESLLQELNAHMAITKTIKNGNITVQLSGN